MKLIGSIFVEIFCPQTHTQTQTNASKKPRHAKHGWGLMKFVKSALNDLKWSSTLQGQRCPICSATITCINIESQISIYFSPWIAIFKPQAILHTYVHVYTNAYHMFIVAFPFPGDVQSHFTLSGLTIHVQLYY